MDEKIVKAKVVAEAAAGGLARKVVPHEVYDASRRARELIEAATAEAKAIVEDARRSAAAIREGARAEGMEEGLTRWNLAVAEVDRTLEKLVRDCEGDLVALAVRLAEKIVGERLRETPAAIVPIVAEALKSVRRERSLTIQVNPQHADEIRRRLDRLQAVVGSARSIEVAPNAAVSPGGCIVETEMGVIDAQLETQLRCLENVLRRTAAR